MDEQSGVREDWETEMEEFIEDIFSSPEKLNKFLDETNFDEYHDHPREEYFPVLKGYQRPSNSAD